MGGENDTYCKFSYVILKSLANYHHFQCFGSGFRGLLDLDLPNPDPGALKKSKMLNQHKIVLLFTILYYIRAVDPDLH